VEEMASKSVLAVFWALFGVFVLLVFSIFLGTPLRPLIGDALGVDLVPLLFFTFGPLFFLLGLALLILAVKVKTERTFKMFLILAGAAAVGMFASMLLHNLVYGLFIQLFGEGFWQRIGIEDEPLFFIMAIFVCPLAFLVGAVGTIVLLVRRRNKLTA
jgi:hypothetical protein